LAKCSIIIPVHNHASLTRQCLKTLLKMHHVPGEMEIIVVDDASTDITPEILADYKDRIEIITHDTNTGYATSCNDGAAIATGDYFVFLNNDTIPQRGWLDALVSYAETHLDVSVVGSKLLFPNGTIQHAGVVIGQEGWPHHIYVGFPVEHPAVNKSRRYQVVTAASALFRRECFEWANGFDASFINGGEDVDICLRLGARGDEIHYCHESVLFHLESVTRTRAAEQDEYQNNANLYLERWAKRVVPDDIKYYVEDELIAVRYGEAYRATVEVSPLLPVVNGEERERRIDRLLDERSKLIFSLMSENSRLRSEVSDRQLVATRKGEGDIS